MKRLVSFLAASLAIAAPARAEWREASSSHFIVYADASEAWLRRYADKLERFDAAMRFIRNVPDRPQDRANRLTVYVLANASRAADLCGKRCGNVAGFYVPRAGGLVTYTIRSEGAGELDLKADAVLFHEYTHHFFLANYSAALPLWVGEGLAEFHGTANVTDAGVVLMGRVPNHRAAGLRIGGPIKIEELFEPPAERKDARFWDVFYGRAWLLTHMLTLGKERPGQFSTYLALVSEGKGGVAAAREAFGDLKQLDREMNKAIDKSFHYATLPAEKLKVGPVSIRTLTSGEAAMMPVRLKSDRGVNRAEALALLPEARRRAAPLQNEAAVQAMLAEAEYDAGNDVEAEAASDRALAVDPRHLEALLYKGRVLVRRLSTAKSQDKAAWQKTRGWFIKANKFDNDAAEPLILNYTSYRAAGEKPTPNAVEGLLWAQHLSRQDPGLRFMAAMQLLEDKQLAESRAMLLPIATDEHSGEPTRAAAVIAMIDAGNAAAALASGADEAEDETD